MKQSQAIKEIRERGAVRGFIAQPVGNFIRGDRGTFSAGSPDKGLTFVPDNVPGSFGLVPVSHAHIPEVGLVQN